jgi:hypothetical protein
MMHACPSPYEAFPTYHRLFVVLDSSSDAQLFAGLEGLPQGVFIPTFRSLRLGTRIALELMVNEIVLYVTGVVSWTRAQGDECEPGIGIGFSELSPDDSRALRALGAHREHLFYESDD